MKPLREIILLKEGDADVWPPPKGERPHNQHCVCHGRNWIWDTKYGSVPNGTNSPTPVQGNVKIACPYGDLRVNKMNEPIGAKDVDDPDAWDL